MDPYFFIVWVLEIFSLDLNVLPFVTFDYIMKWCINVHYFKNVSYSHGKIRLKGIFLGKRINLDLIDMRAKERASLIYTYYLYSLARIISLKKAWNDLEYM